MYTTSANAIRRAIGRGRGCRLSLRRLSVSLALVGGMSCYGEQSTKIDDWIISRHGSLISCHSLQPQPDGSYFLDRYLYQLPDNSLTDGESLNHHPALAEQLRASAKRSPGRLPFYHESYHLNYQQHIVAGDITKGLLSRSLPKGHWYPGWCNKLHLEVTKTETSDQFQQPMGESDTPAEFWRLGIRGSGEKFVPEGMLLIDVAAATTPLMLVAHGLVRDYEAVFDPLFRQKPIAFDYSSYRPYSNDHIPMWQLITSVSGSLALLSTAMATMVNALFLPNIGLGAGGLLVGLWHMRDMWQTPEFKSEKHRLDLSDRLTHAREYLALLHQDAERYKRELANDYGWNQQEHDFQLLVHALREKRASHEQELLTQQARLNTMEEHLRDLEEQRADRDRLDEEFQTLDSQLNRQRQALLEQEKTLLMRNKNKPALEVQAEWEKNRATFKELQNKHGELQRQRDKQGNRVQLVTMVTDMHSRVSRQKAHIEEKSYLFEQQSGKPLELLESYLRTYEETQELDERVKNLQQELDKVKVHVHLMALLTAYQNHQRINR